MLRLLVASTERKEQRRRLRGLSGHLGEWGQGGLVGDRLTEFTRSWRVRERRRRSGGRVGFFFSSRHREVGYFSGVFDRLETRYFRVPSYSLDGIVQMQYDTG